MAAPPPAEMTPAPVTKREIALIAALTLLAAALVLPRLGQRHLWEDEAYTALYAQSVLDRGLPRVWDGVNLMAVWQYDAGKGFLEIRTPWLPYYLLAGVYGVLGPAARESTWAARIVFALAGIACVPVLYGFVRRMAGRAALAGVSSAILALSTDFLLYSRQARYYSLVVLFTLLVLWGYEAMRDRSRRGVLLFGLSGALLFHTMHLAYATLMLSVACVALLTDRRKDRLIRLAIGGVLSAALSIPWLVAVGLYRPPPMSLVERLRNAAVLFGWHFRDFHALGMMPLLMVPAVGLAIVSRREGRWRIDGKLLGLAVVILVSTLTTSLLTIQPVAQTWHADMRYAVQLFPLFAVLLAAGLLELWRRLWPLAAAAAVLLVFSNVLSWAAFEAIGALRWPMDRVEFRAGVWGYELGPPDVQPMGRKIQFPLPSYLYEITHDVRDPFGAAAQYLKEHASPGQEVFTLPIEAAEALRVTNPNLLFCHRWRPQWGMRPAWMDALPPYVSGPTEDLQWIVNLEPHISPTDRLRETYPITGSFTGTPLHVLSAEMSRPDRYLHIFWTITDYSPHLETYIYKRDE